MYRLASSQIRFVDESLVIVAEDEDFEVEDVPKPPPAATDAWDGEDEDDDIKVCR